VVPQTIVTPPPAPKLKGILKNKLERSPVAPNALNYRGPEPSSTNLATADNNTVEETRFSKVVDSKDLYARRMSAKKKEKYLRARHRSTDDLPTSFRPKRRDDSEPDEDDGDQANYKPPFTA
jgi:hypothetical protein